LLEFPSLFAFLSLFPTQWIVMEFVPGGDLFDSITEYGAASELAAWIMFRQLLEALEFMHVRDLAHLDVR
jgi:serine/threonine protein kinase